MKDAKFCCSSLTIIESSEQLVKQFIRNEKRRTQRIQMKRNKKKGEALTFLMDQGIMHTHTNTSLYYVIMNN